MVSSISSLNGQLTEKHAFICQQIRSCRCSSLAPQTKLAAKPQCVAALQASSVANVAPLYGRPQPLQTVRSTGPLATYQGSAQVTGLLKERSQDYYVVATDVAFEGGYYCSETPWTSYVERRNGCHAPDALRNCAGNGCGSSTAGCSTVNSGTGVVSSNGTGGAPSIVVTGVFDGHGGEMSARYAQQTILSYVANDRGLHTSLSDGDVEETTRALRDIFRRVDTELLALAASASASVSKPACGEFDAPPTWISSGPTPASPTAALGSASGDFHDGTTALVTLQLGGLMAVANAGDSRAVLCRRGEAVRLSRDHTPALRSERERIEAAGGRVVVARGAARVLVPLAGRTDVMQALSVSRSLGDPDFKACGLLTAEPDVAVVPLLPGEDLFLIAASDGLWGRVDDQEAVDCVNVVLKEYSGMSPAHSASAAKAAARRLLRLALDQGSVDDVTVVVSVFAWE